MALHAYSLRAAIRILQPRQCVTQNSVAVRFPDTVSHTDMSPTLSRCDMPWEYAESTYHLDGVLISDHIPRGTHAFPCLASRASVLSSALCLRKKADTALFGLIGRHQFPNIRFSGLWRPVLCNAGLPWRAYTRSLWFCGLPYLLEGPRLRCCAPVNG